MEELLIMIDFEFGFFFFYLLNEKIDKAANVCVVTGRVKLYPSINSSFI